MSTTASIDVELVYDRFLGRDDALTNLQGALLRLAPKWSEQALVYRSSRDQDPLDLSVEHALRDAVLRAAGERGPTYETLVARYGAGNERVFGSAELRGATPDLTVIVSVDEHPVSRLGDALQLGNTIALQLRRKRVQGQPVSAWATDAFEALAETTSPASGAISSSDEYNAKVMSDGPGVAAVGRDFGRYLPGAFTANFFGPPYVELIGRARLLAAPRARAVDAGVLITAGDDPAQWDSAERQECDDELLAHLGREYFFSKTAMPATTVAPDWVPDQ